MKTNSILTTFGIAALLVAAIVYFGSTKAKTPQSIAEEAYLYGYPLVLMEATKDTGEFPVNSFKHVRDFPDASFTTVVRPNVDTLYSTGFLDLSQGPVALEVPDVGQRYFLVQLMDAWSEVFSSLSPRTQTAPGQYLIVGPDWNEKISTDAEIIQSPTNLVWAIVRLRLLNEDSLNRGRQFQDQFALRSLSRQQRSYTPTNRFNISNPSEYVNNLSTQQFLDILAKAMQDNPAHKEDSAIVADLSTIGLIPGEKFSGSIKPEIFNQIEKGFSLAKEKMADIGNKEKTGEWYTPTKDIGKYGTDYLARAQVALTGFGANIPEDAVYSLTSTDNNGQPLQGNSQYKIHFTKENAPQANAFWSLTAYDERDLLVDNPINRYNISSSSDVVTNQDGSVDIFLQSTPVQGRLQANWLPTPRNENFSLTMRMYWPKRRVLTGEWSPPEVEKID